MSDVTRLLESMQKGDDHAAHDLLPLVYAELRRIAAYKMADEPDGHTLQPTALVHEAWLRLVKDGQLEFAGRAHFFAVAAEAMRRILIESARRKRSLKRGGDAQKEEFVETQLPQPAGSEEMLAVDDALDLLAAKDPQTADLVKLRYFVGMTTAQAAEVLGITEASAKHYWIHARTWLYQEIKAARNG
jgi:RNA polymerase sigma factor (TIGR02999 family)